jgi:hypothetical protein
VFDDGKWEYNGNWWGGANNNDRAFAEKILKDGTLKDQASKVVQKQLFDEGQTAEEAQKKTNDLINKNQGIDGGKPSVTVKKAQDVINGGAGKAADGTRDKATFGAYIFPTSLREGGGGQDFLKFDMMKYQPKDFSKETFAFKDRSIDVNKKSIGTVILPIPGGIQDGQAVTWGGQTMSPIDMALANVALEGVTEGPGAAVSATMASAISNGDIVCPPHVTA